MAIARFSYRKIGVLLVWVSLILPLFAVIGSKAFPPSIRYQIFSREADPELAGPENLCIIFGGVFGTFSGGGDPATDVYTWLVTGPDGGEVFNRSGGAQFETIVVQFNSTGSYTVNLSVRRNSTTIYSESMSVRVQQGPELVIQPDYLLCGDSPTEITAINPNTPNLSQYNIIWKDLADNVVGNTNTISVTKEGYYKVELFLPNSSGQADCLVTGTAYVGPYLDFNLQLSTDSVCQGQSLEVGTDRPLSGEWFLVYPNSSDRVSLGTAYSVSIQEALIPDPGIYTVIFSASDASFPDCKSERKATFEVLEAPKLQVSLAELPDNCSSDTGTIEILTQSPLDSLIIVETGFLATDIPLNQNITVDFLKPQLYTIAGYSNGCENVTIINVEPKNPPVIDPDTPDIILPEIIIEPEICSETGLITGSVQLSFNQGEVTGEYRIIGQTVGAYFKGNFQDSQSLTIPLGGGTYLLELKIEGCTYPIQEITIPGNSQVEFSKPSQIIICESFEFLPETDQDLVFTLKNPDGSEQTLPAGESFTLTQEGEYELLGKSADPDAGICPKTEKFTATFSKPFSFGVSIFEQDCFGNLVYQADLEGYLPEETSIRWFNPKGEVVGRGRFLYPASFGEFSVIIQPLISGFCPIEPVSFTVEAPIFQVETLLEATKICPEPGTSTIELTTDTVNVKSIQWIFFDDLGTRQNLPQFDNQKEITVNTPGNYEVVVYNRIGCEVGREFIKVENSVLLDQPFVEEVYGICSKGELGPVIDPGEFEEYFWYFEDTLVSSEPEFSPRKAGDYYLKVITLDGCEFFASFRTYDACSFEIVVPNAMILGDPERNFEVRVAEGVTEIELFILNRQGALVHHQKSEEIQVGEISLTWDGKYNGTYIPTGTYVVTLIGRNPQYGFEEKITQSLLVLE